MPCALELGFPDAGKLLVFVGIYAHKDTPEEIKRTLFNALKKTYDDPEFQKGCRELGYELRFGEPEFIKEEIKRGVEVGVPLLKELGLYLEK